jgi:hypothetical protein
VNTSKDALQSIVRHPYAWPGGYPLFAITTCGAALCKKCCKDNYRIIREAQNGNLRDGWQVDAVDVNWEETDLLCDDCGDLIESAYGES